MNRIAFIAASILLATLALAAPRTKSITYDDATVRVTHGSFLREEDGSYRVEACATVSATSDGGSVPIPMPCASGTGATFGTAVAAAVAAWRAANGY